MERNGCSWQEAVQWVVAAVSRQIAALNLDLFGTFRMAGYDDVYRHSNMAPKLSKRVRKCVDGAAVWGAQIFGERGIVGDRVSRRWLNVVLSTFVALEPTTSREVIESITGS